MSDCCVLRYVQGITDDKKTFRTQQQEQPELVITVYSNGTGEGKQTESFMKGNKRNAVVT